MPASTVHQIDAQAIARRELETLSQPGGVSAKMARGSDGRMRVMNAMTGAPLGVVVSESQADRLDQLRVDEKREGDGRALLGIAIACGVGLLIAAIVLQTVYQRGRATGANEGRVQAQAEISNHR
jgi:hypothetical protein